jgi:hypothetical protein
MIKQTNFILLILCCNAIFEKKVIQKQLLLLLFTIVCVNTSIGQTKTGKMDCSAKLENDLLTIENSHISRVYDWNGGNLITKSITDKQSGKVWDINTKKPDLSFPGEAVKAENGTFKLRDIPETAIAPQHLEAEVVYSLGKLEI